MQHLLKLIQVFDKQNLMILLTIFQRIRFHIFILSLSYNNLKETQQAMQNQIVNLNSNGTLYNYCKEALELFLAGQSQKLASKLEQIYAQNKNQQKNPLGSAKQAKKGKFEYQLNFDDEQDQQQPDSKKHTKVLPKFKAQRKSDYCMYCPQNQQLHLLSASNYVYLSMPKLKSFRKYPHYIIAPVDHIQTRIGADEHIQDQIKNYQKCLIQMLDKAGLHAVFVEQYTTNNSHIYIECIGIPLKKAYDLPFFFKQALENVEGFWATHKKIIEIRKEKGGLEKQIPKQIKYFYIDFGLGYGYAHVIEDQKFWDRKFCYEIIASAVGLESYEVKTTEEFGEDELELKSAEFQKMWKPFDWTVLIQAEKKG